MIRILLLTALAAGPAQAGGLAAPIVEPAAAPPARTAFCLFRCDDRERPPPRRPPPEGPPPEGPPEKPPEEPPKEPGRLGKWEAISIASGGTVGPGGLKRAPDGFRDAVMDELRSRGSRGDWTDAVDRLREAMPAP